MTSVWRLNIKTASEEHVDPRQFCLSSGIMGIGWAVDGADKLDWDTYYNLGMVQYYNEGDNGWWPAINAVRNRMSVNDLCWARDWNGVYYLGRITGEWEYKGDEKNLAADIVNIRQCDWKRIGTVDAVPGKIVNSFIPARTLQAVNDDTIMEFSKFLYNSLSDDFKYTVSGVETDIFSLLSAEDCEDVVGLYLQDLGYRIFPSSCKSHTAAYEFVMKHCKTNVTAVTQVNNGSEPLNIDDFASIPGEVYLFTTRGSYVGKPVENVHCISAETIKDYLSKNIPLMPPRMQTWVRLAKDVGIVVS